MSQPLRIRSLSIDPQRLLLSTSCSPLRIQELCAQCVAILSHSNTDPCPYRYEASDASDPEEEGAEDDEEEEEGDEEGEGEGIVQLDPDLSVPGTNRLLPAQPAAKKRKTAPAPKVTAPQEVDDEEEPEEDEDEEAVPLEDDEGEDEEDGDAEADNDADGAEEATAKTGGPAAAAKAAKKGQVPKEDNLSEVEAEDEE